MEIGYALIKNKKIIDFQKGINLDVRDIARNIKKTDYDWALFHTRRASVGEKTNKNCHPFLRKNILLAMNGTEHSVEFISNPKDISDTEAIVDVIDKYNLGITALRNFSSIFMGFYKGKPFVVADNTYNIKILNNKIKNAVIFASDFPKAFKKDIFISKNKFIWNGGEMPKSLTKYKKRYFLNSYNYYSNYYGQYYFDNIEGGNDDYDVAV